MSHLKSYRLPSFTLTARELTLKERQDNQPGIAEGRDYIAIEIRAKSEGWPAKLVVCVGSPICGDWSEDKAARSALSFASEPSCWDEPKDRAWVDCHAETLISEASCHGVLGKNLREG